MNLLAPTLSLLTLFALPASAGDEWTPLVNDGLGDRTRAGLSRPIEFNGRFYTATGTFNGPAQIYSSSDGASWTPVGLPGLGDPDNNGIGPSHVFNGMLYAGTSNLNTGGQIWRTADGVNWTQVGFNGLGFVENIGVFVEAEFQGMLFASTNNVFTGAQLWRSADGVTWNQVGAQVLTDPFTNFFSPQVEFGGELFIGSGNFFTGGKLYKSANGSTWQQVGPPGLGDPFNWFLNPAAVFQGELWVGTGHFFMGQIWSSADGASFNPRILDGFGVPGNDDLSILIASGGELHASASNFREGANLWSSSNGSNWSQATPFGLGTVHNFGAFPAELGGELYLATFNFTTGAQLWVKRPLPAIGGSYCQSTANSTGQAATISGAGDVSLSSLGFCLTAVDAPPFSQGVFFYGQRQTNRPFGDGVMCVGGPLRRTMGAVRVDGSGSATRYVDYGLPLANAILAGGGGVHYQFWFRDRAVGQRKVNLSNALTIVHTP